MANRRHILEPETLLQAYAQGLFPMGMENGEIAWFSPDPRGVIPLTNAFHIPHGLRRVLKKAPYEIRINTAFADVMRGCAARATTWIDDTIFKSYVRLHYLGHAHSVETWLDGALVGGLYGVALGGAFFGESMFSRATDASKIALVALVNRLREREFSLLDTQWTTAHLRQFGVEDIPRHKYLRQLQCALASPAVFA
jgi:leucyl/phenylalanyl-tRNA---protein transferase